MQSIIKKTLSLLLAMILATAAFGLTVQTASAVTGPTSLSLKVASGSGTSAVVDVNGKVKVYVSSVYPFSASKSCYWSVYSGSTYGKISSKYNTYCYVQGIKSGETVTLSVLALEETGSFVVAQSSSVQVKLD